MSDTGSLELLKEFATYNSPPGSGNAYAADFLRQIMPIDEPQWRIAADTVPIALAPAYGSVVSALEPLGAYRLHRSDDASLLMNNAPADLWDEYRRIEQTKAFVEQSLSKLGLKPRVPSMLAPWEARVVALCVRFGSRQAGRGLASRTKLGWFALTSLWHWPNWSFQRKALQSAWMMLVFFLPSGIARGLAAKHRASVGLPVQRSSCR